MADISRRITQKSLKAKKAAAIKTIKAQTKERIKQIKLEYAMDPERAKAKVEEKERKKELRLQKVNARISYNSRQARMYTLGEDIFCSVSHGIGAGLSVAAIVLLVILAVYHAPDAVKTPMVASYAIFGSALFILYIASTLRHAIFPQGARNVFSIINRCSIYFLEAATFTPLIINGPHAGKVLALTWVACAGLMAIIPIFKRNIRFFPIFTYVLFMWVLAAAYVVEPMLAGTVTKSLKLFLAGAIVYTVGFAFRIPKTYKLTHCMYHLLSMAGSILHFFAFYSYFD